MYLLLFSERTTFSGDRPPAHRFHMNRDRMYFLHRWCGLISGLLLLLFSSTGVGLLFYDQWEQRADSAWNEVSNPSGVYSWDASFRKVLESYPGWSVSGYPPAGPDRSLVYALEKDGDYRRLYVHPVTGLILYEAAAEERPFHRVLQALHGSLLAGRAGRIVIVLTGLLLLVSLVTGFQLFRRPVHSSKRTALPARLHARIGVGSLLFQFIVVITGTILAIAHLRTNASGQAPAASDYVPVTFSVDAAQEQVRRQYPGFRAEVLRLAPDHLIFAGRFQEDAFLSGPSPSQIIIRKPGQRPEVLTAASATGGEKAVRLSRSLHGGRFGGWPVQLLYAVLGMTSFLLAVTGFRAGGQGKARAEDLRQGDDL